LGLSLILLVSGQSSAQKANTLLSSLQTNYFNVTGCRPGLWLCAWWNSANSLEALTEYMLYTKSQNYTDVITDCFDHTTTNEAEIGSYDDSQWWGIAWYRNYQLTGNQEYLDRAVSVWNYIMTYAWDDTCGGGVYWAWPKRYKNAVTNELFFVLSALLAQEFPSNSTYREWVMKEWTWLNHLE